MNLNVITLLYKLSLNSVCHSLTAIYLLFLITVVLFGSRQFSLFRCCVLMIQWFITAANRSLNHWIRKMNFKDEMKNKTVWCLLLELFDLHFFLFVINKQLLQCLKNNLKITLMLICLPCLWYSVCNCEEKNAS